MNNTMNMTEGRPSALLVKFAVPLLLANICQVLYTLVDSTVVGRLLGVNAFAAVGASWVYYWLLLDVILGITQGFGTLFAQQFGANNLPGLRKSFSTAVSLTATLGLVFSLGGALLCGPALMWLATPAEIIADATAYLRMLTGGICISFVYNLLGSMLRSLGDSKTPLFAVIVSTLLNIVLDVVLVAAVPMGVRGVALATLLSQIVASAICLRKLRSIPVPYHFSARPAWDGASAHALLRLGLPMGFRNLVISLGGFVVQFAINGYGTIFIAGVTAAKRLSDLLWMIGSALDGAIATFVAQNYGARLLTRVREGITAGRRMLLSSAAVILAFTLLFGRVLLRLFLSGEAEQVSEALDVAWRQLCVTACGLPILHLLFLYRSSLQGLGDTLMPMLSGFMELGMRIVCVLLLPSLLGVWSVYLADAAGWVAAALQLYIAYRIVYNKRCRQIPTAQV